MIIVGLIFYTVKADEKEDEKSSFQLTSDSLNLKYASKILFNDNIYAMEGFGYNYILYATLEKDKSCNLNVFDLTQYKQIKTIK